MKAIHFQVPLITVCLETKHFCGKSSKEIDNIIASHLFIHAIFVVQCEI